MNGHLFQTHIEATKPGQFNKYLEALKILAATEYKKAIKYLGTLFRNLEKLSIPMPIFACSRCSEKSRWNSYVQQGQKSQD